MRRTKEEADVTRQALLEAAINVFNERGYTATRLSDIAEKANVTRGAIYWHFENKQNMFMELLKTRTEPLIQLIDTILTSSLCPVEKIKRLLFDFTSKVIADPNFRAHQQLEYLKTGMLDNLDELEQYAEQMDERYGRLIIKIIDEGKRLGEISRDVVSSDVIILCNVFLTGAAFIFSQEKELHNLKRILPQVVDTYLRFLQPHEV